MKTEKTKLNSAKIELSELRCKNCRKKFAIDKNYIGIVTCPYCGNYVEG